MRTGIGYDIHRLTAGRPLVLGGVRIEYELGFLAHSDGDVVVHALIDALLGAAGLGDIGEHFPDTDPAYKDIDSVKLLEHVCRLVGEHRFRIENVDVIIHAEKPKLRDHKAPIRNRLAGLLKIDPSRVNVKAKTNEGLDAVGQGQAIAAWAVATLSKFEG